MEKRLKRASAAHTGVSSHGHLSVPFLPAYCPAMAKTKPVTPIMNLFSLQVCSCFPVLVYESYISSLKDKLHTEQGLDGILFSGIFQGKAQCPARGRNATDVYGRHMTSPRLRLCLWSHSSLLYLRQSLPHLTATSTDLFARAGAANTHL